MVASMTPPTSEALPLVSRVGLPFFGNWDVSSILDRRFLLMQHYLGGLVSCLQRRRPQLSLSYSGYPHHVADGTSAVHPKLQYCCHFPL